MDKIIEHYIKVETDSYVRSFERLFTAYTTGIIGECEVGKDYAALFAEEHDPHLFEEIIFWNPDANGCYRPVGMDPNNNHCFHIFLSNSNIENYKPIMETVRERAKAFPELYENKKPEFLKTGKLIKIKKISLIRKEKTLKIETLEI